MLLIGLTGGIASGKSMVARQLAALGAVHIDADLVAREVVALGQPALAEIAETFGSAVIRADGTLDRAALGAIVFSDAVARERLNAITHPAVWRRSRELIDAAIAANPDAVVVYDVPLLVEAAPGRPMDFDRILVVTADRETRIARLTEIRGLSRHEAEQRLGAQASDDERRAIADVVIDNSADLGALTERVNEVWTELTAGV